MDLVRLVSEWRVVGAIRDRSLHGLLNSESGCDSEVSQSRGQHKLSSVSGRMSKAWIKRSWKLCGQVGQRSPLDDIAREWFRSTCDMHWSGVVAFVLNVY